MVTIATNCINNGYVFPLFSLSERHIDGVVMVLGVVSIFFHLSSLKGEALHVYNLAKPHPCLNIEITRYKRLFLCLSCHL